LLFTATHAVAQPKPPPVGSLLNTPNNWPQHQQFNALDILSKVVALARSNNPRVNPPMSNPPIVTTGTIADGTLTNITAWNSSNAGVFRFYGGNITSDGEGCAKFPSSTVSGVYSAYVWRVRTVADTAKIQYKVLDVAGLTNYNFIVDGQYISGTVIVPDISGYAYIELDFTNIGGRQIHDITLESTFGSFCQVAIAATETLQAPQGTSLRMANQGDSFTASGGMNPLFVGYAQILADLLGIQDLWNLGVGSTGYLNTNGGTQLNCAQRISDLVSAQPDIIALTCGHDDTAYTPTQLQAAVLADLVSIRQQVTNRSGSNRIPIIVAPLWGNIALSTSQPLETAIQAAVTAFGDPLVFMITDANDPNGPAMTGTGWIGGTQNGNTGIYISGSDHIHPYQVNYGPYPEGGHWFYATWLANKIMQQVIVP
jgi:hypothetical protein